MSGCNCQDPSSTCFHISAWIIPFNIFGTVVAISEQSVGGQYGWMIEETTLWATLRVNIIEEKSRYTLYAVWFKIMCFSFCILPFVHSYARDADLPLFVVDTKCVTILITTSRVSSRYSAVQ